MASGFTFDRQQLITNQGDDPPTYQEAISHANVYGTFIDPSMRVTALPNPYQFESEQSQPPIPGRCPTCKIGTLDGEFTCTGICCALLCFPIGILCCLACRQRRCDFCDAVFP